MKKIYTSLLATALLSGTAVAQQLPNSDFEGAWVDCVPWNTANTTNTQGTTPTGWCVSNVVTPGMSLGNATVASKVDGKESTSAVKVFNKSAAGQVIPGYVTLGTTWSTAKIKGTTPSDEDGGTWGGLDFTSRPDAIAFDYIRTNGSGSTQPATAIVYLWTGQTTQASVPGANSYSLFTNPSNPATCNMVNRDRNILGLETIKGGAVTESDDFEKVASAIHKITEPAESWTSAIVDINYDTPSTPEKINVIFSASDYFANRANHKGDDALTVDNVKLVYYSRLSSITIGGTALEGFAPDKFTYQVEGQLPSSPMDIDARLLGTSESAEFTATVNNADNTVTITVTNEQGADIDGKTSHTYTINFTSTSGVVNSKEYTGMLIVALSDEPSEIPNTTITMDEMSDGTYAMSLEKFGADPTDPDDTGMGDINVYDITKNGINLSGEAKGLELMGGFIKADVDLKGTLEGDNLILHLTVKWLDDDGVSVQAEFPVDFYSPAELYNPQPAELSYRRKYTDGSSRYYSEIAYMVNDNVTTVYSTADPTAESYYVKPINGAWQEEGAYIDFTDKVIEVPYDAKQFTVILKGLPNTAIHWSQTCVYVDWNNNGSFIDAGETNGVVNRDINPNAAGGGLVITDAGERDVINLPAGVAEGDTFPMLIALTEPKGVNGDQDLWSSHWEWSTEIFNNNLCSLINGQAYGLTLKMGRELSAIDNVAVDNADAPAEFFNLQGVRVDADNLTPGIYIMRKGNDVKKVLVK